MQLATEGFHHLTLVSGDAGRTAAFYRDLLGLALVSRTADGDGARILWFGDERGRPGTLLRVIADPGGSRGRWGIGGVHHLAFGVDDDEALLRWKRRLADHGVHAGGPYDRGYFTSLYFADPDGQILEIATAGPGYAIDEPAEALGRELMLPPQRIVAGHRDEAAIAALTWPEPVPEITPGMALRGLHHVSGITNDLARAGEFYQAALGLRLVKQTINRDDPNQLHWFWARYDGRQVAPGSSYTLFGWPDSWKHARAGVGQTRSIAFRARDDEELGAWRDHLRALGVQTSDVEDHAFFRAIAFRAPDGQVVEIATDGPGFAACSDPKGG